MVTAMWLGGGGYDRGRTLLDARMRLGENVRMGRKHRSLMAIFKQKM